MAYAYAVSLTPDNLRVRDYLNHALFGTPLPAHYTKEAQEQPGTGMALSDDQKKWLEEQSEKYGIPEVENTDPNIAVNDPRMIAALDAFDELDALE